MKRFPKILYFTIVSFMVLSCFSTGGIAGSGDDVRALEDAFIKASREAGQAVVSISTVHTQKVSGRQHYFGPFPQNSPFRDEFFDQFFRDFFGELPEQEYKQFALGSGVIINREGYILTNEHVIQRAEKISVTLPDGREFTGELKGSDPRSDLAVLKIEADNLPVARLGDSDSVRIGQWAIAIGNPFAFAVRNPEPTVTVGVISALNRTLPRTDARDRDYTDLIQTDAAINPGNSGGPLLNLKGEVIGINVAIFSTSGGYQGVGFAIPINTAKYIISSLTEGKRVRYGWLGVSIQDISQDLASYFGLPDRNGILVVKVLEASPAKAGGFQDGDIIKLYNTEEVNNTRELLKKIGRTEIGKKVKIGVIRDKRALTLDVEVGERSSELWQLGELSRESWRGIEVREITAEIAERFQVEINRGVIISHIEAGSAAADSGLRIGDVILEINKRTISSPEDYRRLTQAIEGDALLRTIRGYAIVKGNR